LTSLIGTAILPRLESSHLTGGDVVILGKLVGAGSAAFLAGVTLIAFTVATDGGPIAAGGIDPCATPSNTPTATPDPQITSFGQTQECVTPTATVRRRTATAEPATETPVVTEDVPTEVPATEAPPPATSTPSGSAGGGGIAPPNTGDGSSAGGTSARWLIAAGGLLALTGGGLALAGVKRR